MLTRNVLFFCFVLFNKLFFFFRTFARFVNTLYLDAVMHMYTHDRLWPQLSDLCAFLGSECNIIDGGTGGNCFDEACSTPWAYIADKYPGYAIPMACQSTTVELRGEYDVRCGDFIIL